MTMAYVLLIHLMLVCPAIRLVSVLMKEHAERRRHFGLCPSGWCQSSTCPCQETAKDHGRRLSVASFLISCPQAAGRGLTQEQVSVILSAVFHSVLSSTTHRASGAASSLSPEQEALRRCMTYRKSFSMTEIALPAAALRNQAVAKWVRDQGVVVDVRTSGELATAITAGVRPVRMTLYAEGLSHPDLLSVAMLGVGRIVVSAVDEIELLGSVVARRHQGVVVRMTDVNMPQIGDSVQWVSRSTRSREARRSARSSRASASISSDCFAKLVRTNTISSAIRPRSVT